MIPEPSAEICREVQRLNNDPSIKLYLMATEGLMGEPPTVGFKVMNGSYGIIFSFEVIDKLHDLIHMYKEKP